MSTLSLCVIGDEILNGKTIDTNSQYVAQKCFDVGLQLKEIRVIKDDSNEIKRAISSLTKTSDIVFTSGGIGPTHDDITYQSLAETFDKRLVYDVDTGERLKKLTGAARLNDGQIRMCTVPEPDEPIIYTEGLWQPIVCVKNVYIFPGVPRLFRNMVDTWMNKKSSHYNLQKRTRIALKTNMKESEISITLGNFQERAISLGWTIGSYPKMEAYPSRSWVEISISGPSLSNERLDKLDQLISDLIETYSAEKM